MAVGAYSPEYAIRNLANDWFWRFYDIAVEASPSSHGKSICSLYMSGMDWTIRLESQTLETLIEQAAKLENRAPNEVLGDLSNALASDSKSISSTYRYTCFLQELLLRVEGKSPGDKYRLPKTSEPRSPTKDLLDFLADVFTKLSQSHPDLVGVSIGTASAIVAEILTGLKKKVALWTRYHSTLQAECFGPEVQFLVEESEGSVHFIPVTAQSHGRKNDPDIRNYPFEYTGEPFEYGALKVQPKDGGPGRVIVIAPGYLRYNTSDHVDASAIPPPINQLFTGVAGVRSVAQNYRYWFIVGLQSVKDKGAQQTLEEDLAAIPPDVTIHIEISGTAMSDWFTKVLRDYVDSVGVNIEELPEVVAKLPAEVPEQFKGEVAGISLEELFDRALWLACELNLDRLYVHGHTVDFVIRADQSATTAGTVMDRESDAVLYAKAITLQKAKRTRSLLTTPGSPSLDPSNISEMVSLFRQRHRGALSFPHAVTALPTSRDGWFDIDDFGCYSHPKYRVVLVPVFWLRNPGKLDTTGLGDITSVISFIYGCYTADPLKSKRAAKPTATTAQGPN